MSCLLLAAEKTVFIVTAIRQHPVVKILSYPYTDILCKSKNLSLCLPNQALRHEGVWGMDLQIHVFLTAALTEDEWSASGPGRFTPGESASGLDKVEKRIFLTVTDLQLRPLYQLHNLYVTIKQIKLRVLHFILSF
jgi:hypothetical protein